MFDLTSDMRLGDRIEGPTIKLIVGSDGYITGSDTSGIDLSADRTLVKLNQRITSSTNNGRAADGHHQGRHPVR